MPRRKKIAAKRSTAEYLTAVKTLAPLHDKIKKLKRRKILRPWEKGMITKVQNRLGAQEGLAGIFPLTKLQRSRLKEKGILISPTIHAIRLENTGVNVKVGVRGGKLHVRSSGRGFIFDPLDPDAGKYLKHAKHLFDTIPLVTLYFWHVRGRHTTGYDSMNQFTQRVIEKFNEYLERDPNNWLLGIAYLAA